MKLNKVTVDDLNVKGKKVLVRCDFNVPLKDGVITNDNRITAALPTIKKLIADGGKVILCSHLGKPKNGPEEKFSLAPVAVRLSELLGKEVVFANDDEVVGENAKKAVAEMNDGDVVLLQNTRFRKEETKNLEPLPESGFQKDKRNGEVVCQKCLVEHKMISYLKYNREGRFPYYHCNGCGCDFDA